MATSVPSVRWVALMAGILLFSCVEPQPKTLTLPSLEDAQRQERQALAKFNARRFSEECVAIDSVLRATGREAQILPGGVRLTSNSTSTLNPLHESSGNEWRPEAGHRVVWSWIARSLDGDSLAAGVDEFTVDRDAVPKAFHEAAKHAGHRQDMEVWSPSVSAFGVRGVPGEIPPYTPVHLEVSQRRSIRDTAWARGMMRGEVPESLWLEAFVIEKDDSARPERLEEGLYVTVHSSRTAPIQSGDVVLLRIRTSAVMGGRETETDLEWPVGTPDQLVPALENALAQTPTAHTLSIWATSIWAFGEAGIPSAEIPPRSPVRFHVEVVPL